MLGSGIVIHQAQLGRVSSSSKSGEESVDASVELGCARTRYFNMLPSGLHGFGVDNFLFFQDGRYVFAD